MTLTVPQIFIPWAAGLAACSFLVRRWGGVRAGFNRITDLGGLVILIVAVFAGPGSVPEIIAGRSVPASLSAGTLLGVLASAALVVSLVLSFREPRRGTGSDRSGFAPAMGEAVAAALGFAACIGLGLSQQDPLLGVARAFAAAVFLGVSSATMLLGHWYLVDPNMPRDAIRRLAGIYLLSTPIEILALLLPPGVAGAFDAEKSGIGAYLPPFWVALALTCLVFGVLILAALRERGYPAVMAATGLSYLTIMSSFGVDVIGKALIAG